jgi:hypothetical protein
VSGTFRVLITGSRSWSDEQAIREALASVIALQGPENVTVVHGAASCGADAIADRVATSWGGGLMVERHPADWQRHGRSAGFRRNAEMVALGADVCLAFVLPCTDPKCRKSEPHGSHGASHTARLAEKAGIPTRRFPEADRG